MADGKDTAPRRKRTEADFSASLARAKARGKAAAAPVELPGDLMRPEQPSNVAKLPAWSDAVRGVPNAALRSALFGAIKRGKRAYQDGVKKASVDGVTVIHTGPQLDQADLEVWEHCIELARKNGLGEKIHFGLGYFLTDIGRSTGGKDSEWLKGSLRRLSASVVEITDGKKTYWGSMIYRGVRDEETGKHVIEVNPDIAKLYGTDGWTAIERSVRTALKGQPLAQWLHGFYASHARPYPMKVETLHKLCGSQAKRLADYRTDLRSALQKLAAVTGWTWKIEDDLVHINKPPSAQARRIARKARPSGLFHVRDRTRRGTG